MYVCSYSSPSICIFALYCHGLEFKKSVRCWIWIWLAANSNDRCLFFFFYRNMTLLWAGGILVYYDDTSQWILGYSSCWMFRNSKCCSVSWICKYATTEQIFPKQILKLICATNIYIYFHQKWQNQGIYKKSKMIKMCNKLLIYFLHN